MASPPKAIGRVREFTGDHVLDRIQAQRDRIALTVNAQQATISGFPIRLDGKLVKGVTFTAGVALTVQHNLGRAFSGYFATRNYGANVANTFGESGVAVSDPNNQTSLITTVNAVMDIYFY